MKALNKFLILISLIFLSIETYAQNYGVVNFSVNFMRETPNYTGELGNQGLMGSVVEILDQQGYWVKIKTCEPYTAWINELGLVPMTKDEIIDYLKAPKYICTQDYTHIYSEANDQSTRVSDLVMGDLVRIKYKGKSPIRTKGYSAVIMPSGKEGWVKTEYLMNFEDWAKNANPSAENIINIAYKMLGVPYLWGGTSIKGVDCSGLVKVSTFMNGLMLPRNASQQAKIGDMVDIGPKDNRTIENLKRGDLLFFGNVEKEKVTHVGIYLGDNLFIHSSQVVRINHLIPTETDKYDGISRLIYARRIEGNQDKGKGFISLTNSPYYFYIPDSLYKNTESESCNSTYCNN